MYLNTLKNIAISSLCRAVSWDLGALGCFFVPQEIGIFNQRENPVLEHIGCDLCT